MKGVVEWENPGLSDQNLYVSFQDCKSLYACPAMFFSKCLFTKHAKMVAKPNVQKYIFVELTA